MRKITIFFVILGFTWLPIQEASANESPNWLLTKSNGFTLQTTSDLNTRGTVTIKGAIPAKESSYDQAIYKQQTSGGTGKGICSWSMNDFAYPGYLDQGGIGILVLGQQLTKDEIDDDSFSMKGIRYISYFAQSPSEYQEMYINSTWGSEDAINLNGTDLLFASTEFRTNRSASQYFLKDWWKLRSSGCLS
jgi:hypothetical protein